MVKREGPDKLLPKRRAVLPVNKPRVHKVKTKIIPRKQKHKESV